MTPKCQYTKILSTSVFSLGCRAAHRRKIQKPRRFFTQNYFLYNKLHICEKVQSYYGIPYSHTTVTRIIGETNQATTNYNYRGWHTCASLSNQTDSVSLHLDKLIAQPVQLILFLYYFIVRRSL